MMCLQAFWYLIYSVFLSFWKINGQGLVWKEGTSFSAWLYRIAKNLSLDIFKKRKRIIPCERDELESIIEICSFHENTNEGLDEKITEVIKQLTFDEKNILLLKIHQEKSYEEIAFIINKSQSATRKKYERARKKFIKLYDEIGKEEIIYGNRKQIKSVL